MNRSRDWVSSLAGVAFVLLLVASFTVGGEAPGADGATEEVATFWADNADANVVAALLGGLAAAAAIWFGSAVRSVLRGAEGDAGHLSAIAFTGFAIIGLGGAMWSGFQYAAADTAGDVPVEVTQTLAVLVEWFFLPFAVGIVVAFLAAGTAIVRYGGLPSWLGYLALPVPIFFFTPVWFVGMIGAGVWILAVSAMATSRARAPEAS